MTSHSAATSDRSERGFTLVETLLATILLIALGVGTVGLVGQFAKAINARGSASGGALATESTLSAMRDDASTAFAVFVPTTDVMGQPNSAPAHEFDYYGKAEDGAESWWAYRFDAATSTLRRYDYVPAAAGKPSSIGMMDRSTGAIDPSASYPAITGVRSFTVQTLEANQLASNQNTYGSLITKLVAGGATPAPMPVGFVPTSKQVRTDLYGGNTTVEVSLTTDHSTRTFHLATSSLPSGFTIHAAPAIRAFAYRIDYSHRFWFGFAQKTWARIFEQVQYSYKPSVQNSWKVWCDYQVYGAGIQGIDLGSQEAVYNPKTDFSESMAGAFYTTTETNLKGLNPTGCSQKIPGPTATPVPPAPVTISPGVVDTPPPCFVQGQCWPQNAPVDWAPPSPWPAGTAPPQWCATHDLSTLCGGPGGPVSTYPPGATPNPDTTTYPDATPYPVVSPPRGIPTGPIRPINGPGPIAL